MYYFLFFVFNNQLVFDFVPKYIVTSQNIVVSVYYQITCKYFTKKQIRYFASSRYKWYQRATSVEGKKENLTKSNLLLLQEFTTGTLFTYKLLYSPIHEDIIPESYYCYKKCRISLFKCEKSFQG